MKIAVCDDENMVLEEIKVHIEEIAQQIGIVVEIHLFQDVIELEDKIEENSLYDMILFDIEIGDENGIHVATRVKENYPTIRKWVVCNCEMYHFAK